MCEDDWEGQKVLYGPEISEEGLAYLAGISFGSNLTEGNIDIGLQSTFSWDSAVCYSFSRLGTHLAPKSAGPRN